MKAVTVTYRAGHWEVHRETCRDVPENDRTSAWDVDSIGDLIGQAFDGEYARLRVMPCVGGLS